MNDDGDAEEDDKQLLCALSLRQVLSQNTVTNYSAPNSLYYLRQHKADSYCLSVCLSGTTSTVADRLGSNFPGQ